MRIILKSSIALVCSLGLVIGMPACAAEKTEKKPNILVVRGDDIGQSNISYFTKGMMAYKTPNINRIASEGMAFTDYYGEQSCTAA